MGCTTCNDEACGASALPNPAQLRTCAHPNNALKPCTPGRHCERHARGLGGCVAGHCNPPASTNGVEGTQK